MDNEQNIPDDIEITEKAMELPEIKNPIVVVFLKNVLTELILVRRPLPCITRDMVLLFNYWEVFGLPKIGTLPILQIISEQLHFQSIGFLPVDKMFNQKSVVNELTLRWLLPEFADLGNTLEVEEYGITPRPAKVAGCEFNYSVQFCEEALSHCKSVAKQWREVVDEIQEAEVEDLLSYFISHLVPVIEITHKDEFGYQCLLKAAYELTHSLPNNWKTFNKVIIKTSKSELVIASDLSYEEFVQDFDFDFKSEDFEKLYDEQASQADFSPAGYCFTLHSVLGEASQAFSSKFSSDGIDSMPAFVTLETFANLTNIKLHPKSDHLVYDASKPIYEKDREVLEEVINFPEVRLSLKEIDSTTNYRLRHDAITSLKDELEIQTHLASDDE